MLKDLLQRLAADEISVAEAERQLDAALANDPHLTATTLATLRVERGAGRLREATCTRLMEVARRHQQRSAPPASPPDSDEPEATVIGPPTHAPSKDSQGSGSEGPSDAEVDLPLDAEWGSDEAPKAGADDTSRGEAPAYSSHTQQSPEEDKDGEEEAPTVIARLARTRYISTQRSREQSNTSDEEEEAGTDESTTDAAGGDSGDASGDDDSDEPPTVIARLARSRYGSTTPSRDPSHGSSPASETSPEEEPHLGTDGESPRPRDASHDDPGEQRADSAEPGQASADEWAHSKETDEARTTRDGHKDRQADESAPTVVAPGPGSADQESQDEGGPDPASTAEEETQAETQVLTGSTPDEAGGADTEAATKVMGDGDSTQVATEANGLESPDADSSASGDGGSSGSQSGSTHPSQQSWTPPGSAEDSELKGIGPGSVIKDRFVLEKVLGSGGMGKVYQARDLLKVEAHDRNPYVAMKVLTEDFKQHPEAFIALQRESSRQQQLAHPNIATVYDFDRIGRSGTQVFITMELMQGYPLNTYIKKKVKPRGGLPPEEAIPMIRQLGAALGYAHRREIVHSDFKPGNCFLCNDGTVKVLDFGIARAVKTQDSSSQEGEEAGGEQTYFDPGQLGALTPAYASLEMIQGEEPDPRDDIYALACVSYELLTGHHPFGRKSAQQARDAGLTPAPVKTLKRRQMRGLLRGLAFEREHRTPDVETFVEELEGRLNWHKNPYLIGGGLAAALAVASVGPVMDYMEQRRIQQLVQRAQTGGPEAIQATLEKLPQLDTPARQTIIDEARENIQSYLERRVRAAVNPEQGRYDFSRAEEVVARARELYPDSTAVQELQDWLQSAREQRLNELNQQFMAALEADRLLPSQGQPDAPALPAVVEAIARVQPDHELVTDPRIPQAYASAAQGAINQGAFDRARAYVDTGASLLPEAQDLSNVRDRLRLARLDRIVARRQEKLRNTFDGRLADLSDLAPLRRWQATIADLARRAPDNAVVTALRDAAAPIARDRVAGLTPADWRRAQAFVERNRGLLEALGLHGVVIDALLNHQPSDERAQTRQLLLNQAHQRFEALLAEASFEPRWRGDLRDQLAYIEILAPNGANIIEESQARAARIFAERADALREEQRYDLALAVVDRARGMGLDQPRIAELRSVVKEDRQAFLRQRQQAAEKARLEGLKRSVVIQARARKPEQARETLESIEPRLDSDDPFLSVTVPDVLGEAYKQVAARRAEQGDYAEAMRLAERGLEVAPNSRALQQARKDYKVEVNIAELEEIFRQQLEFDTARASRMVNEIRAWAPERYQRLEQQFIDLLAGRIRGLGESDREKARRLAARTTNVFPGSPRLARLREQMAPEPWPEGSAARAALSAGRLSEAQQILDRALAEMPDHPEVQNFQKDLEQRKAEAQTAFEAYKQAIEQDDLERAQDKLAEARSAWVDNQEFRQAQSELSAKLARERRQQSQVLRRGSGVESLDASGADVVDEDWQPIESTRPCTRNLAGHGTRARAVCFDLLHQRVRGPLMVVVPGGDDASPYAISKYEISNDDYNKYCFLSGECAVDDDAPEDQPKTGLSPEQIRAYVDWLSQRTGRTYRLPNERQWVHAARASGDQPPRDYNCRVTLGGDILKGRDLVDVSVGQQNGWGLKNYIGNAQELVRTSNGLVLRGGAYTDSHAQCSYELERSYQASAQETTGFRVVRKEIPKAE